MPGSLRSRKTEDAAESSSYPQQELPKRSLGFMLAHEQFRLPELVEFGVAAERAGFDFLATSDHLQPWQDNEGHAGMAWVTMAAVGQKTSRVWIGTTVTCPTYRYHPAVVAEGFASLSILFPNRIFLGVGSGEALERASGNRTVGSVAGTFRTANRSHANYSRSVERRAGATCRKALQGQREIV